MLHGSRGFQAHRQVWPYFSGSHLQGRPRPEPVTLVCISRFSRRALVSSVLSPVLESHLKTPDFEWSASSATFPPLLPTPAVTLGASVRPWVRFGFRSHAGPDLHLPVGTAENCRELPGCPNSVD